MSYSKVMRSVSQVIVSALTTIALVGPTVGCYSHRPNSTPAVGQSGRLKIAPDAPITIVRGRSRSDTLLLRSLTQLEGRLIRVTPDTLTLWVERTWPSKRQADNQTAIIPRTVTTDFAARKLDEGRTMVAVVGISVLMLFFIWAATWELDIGGGSTISY